MAKDAKANHPRTLSSCRVEILKNVQAIELETLIKDLYSLCKNNEDNNAKVVISEWMESLTLNIITKIIIQKVQVKSICP